LSRPSIQVPKLADNLVNRVFLDNPLPGLPPEIPPARFTQVDQPLPNTRQRLGIASGNNQAWVADHVRRVAYIGDNTRNCATHGFTDYVGKPF
jgi:hypothetical protein